jgi:menaquinone-dependent protoporphyrinogen IX oxidase
MRILIVYGSTEAHTNGLSDFMAENLKGDGHEVIVSDTGLKHPLPEPGRFDAAFLAASLHVGRY